MRSHRSSTLTSRALAGLGRWWLCIAVGWTAFAATPVPAAPPVELTATSAPGVRIDKQYVSSAQGTVEVPIRVRGAAGADGLQVSIDYDEVYIGYAWYRTSNTNWRVERVAPYGRHRITFILRQINKNLAPADPLQEETALQAIFYIKDAREEDDAELFRRQTPLSLGAVGQQGGVDTFFFTVDAAGDTYRPIPTRISNGELTLYFRDGVEVGSGEITRTAQAFSLPLYLTYLDGSGPVDPLQRTFTVSIDYDEVFLGLVGIMGRSPPLVGPEAEHPVSFKRLGPGTAQLELLLGDSTPASACRLHVADLYFRYSGLPPDAGHMLVEPHLELDRAGLENLEGPPEDRTDGGAAAHSPGTEPGVVEFLPDFFVRGNVDSSASFNGRGAATFRADPTDVILILETVFLGGRSLPCADAADANDNGRIEITDAVSILNHLFRGGPPPVAPYPNPGVDPDQGDPLGCDQPVPYFRQRSF